MSVHEDAADESDSLVQHVVIAQSKTGTVLSSGSSERTTKEQSLSHGEFGRKDPGPSLHPGRLCRLCARRMDSMVYIFGKIGQAHGIVEKINTSLPVTLCEDCVQKLDICHEFAEACVRAEQKLKALSKAQLFISDVVGERKYLTENVTNVPETGKFGCPLCCCGLMLVEDSDALQYSSCSSASHEPVLVTSHEPVRVTSPLRLTVADVSTGGTYRGTREVQKVYNEEKPSSAACRICGDIFDSSEECLAHAKVHSLDDFFPCSVCDLCFSTESSFSRHCVEHRRKCSSPDELRCPRCGSVFGNARAMARHICRLLFRCPDCGKAFRSEARLAFHRRLHGGASATTCRQCGKVFARENNLFEHVRLVHLGEKAHRCPRCGKTFQLRARLVAHLRVHAGERPFRCRVCGGRFHDSATLKGHLVTHLDAKPFQCDKCGRCFSRKTLFKRHVLSHNNDANPPLSRMHKCKLCPDLTLASYSKLVKHRKEAHLADTFLDQNERLGTKPFTCEYCEKSFVYRVTLMSHVRTHTGELPFECELCEKRFPRKRSLDLHRRVHSGDRPHGCATCGKRFAQRAHLRAHERLHTGEKPYACDECGRRFRLKEVRNAHHRKHTGERPFKCAVCEKAFRTSHSYSQHMWIHQGKRPYACQHCGKAFRRSNGLKVHIRIHTGEKPHMCDVCGKCFAQKQDMKKHRNLHANGRL
ncbi:zinc finger protein 431-like isoform X2 [Bacillus rossius redtenbacheri]|uniref:zinc finger protein 431-like isoform X2 n=1 Tax=Bacillus rossius redtenbacheri TaxID=93214 RepID=UPI002FDCE2B4